MIIGPAGTARIIAGMMTASLLAGCAAFAPPLTEQQVVNFAKDLDDQLASPSEPQVGVLNADDAVNRAIYYNHSVRAKELEAALAEAKVRVQAGSMLPNIVVESGYYRRDRPHMSHSNLATAYSTSTDLRTISRDIALSWNILDFGLSFVRARQGLGKALQQHEESNRVRARIIEETRSIYWRAVAFDRIAPAVEQLDREVNSAIALSRAAMRDVQVDPMVPINLQRDILNAQRELNLLQSSLAGATDQLKQLIGLPLMDRLSFDTTRTLPRLSLSVTSSDADVSIALRQRPEIRHHILEMRITDEEVNATILQLLPGVTIGKTYASDTTSYLLHSNWVSWSTKIAGNLMNIARLPADLIAVDAQQKLNRQNALATAALIAMQVQAARARINVQTRSYRDAERFQSVQRQLLHQVRTAVELNKVGRQSLVREKLATLLAEVRTIVAFADLHAAHAAYATARGDPSPEVQNITETRQY